MALRRLTRLLGRSLKSAHARSPTEPLQLLAAWPEQHLSSTGTTVLGSTVGAAGNSTAAASGASATTPSFQANYGVAARQLQNDLETYRVSVVTGNLRGAGTGSAAYVQLIGSHGESDKFVVGNSEDEGLTRGSKVTFDVQVPPIGPIRRVFVEREKASCTATGDGWFLESVIVHGPNGEHYSFPCNAWFGHSDCGDYEGSLERNLLPLVESEALQALAVQAQPVQVAVSGVAFPHPEKVIKNKIRGVNMKGFGYGGEDAYFYATGQNVFGMGVADGVYMWKEQGIDSGTMARTLMETCQHMVAAGCEDVFKVLSIAARHVESEGVQGSCTACLLTINKESGKLQSATLGDSGFLVVGRGPGSSVAGEGELRVKFRTPQLEHEFGCPYQLGHHRYANSPADAELSTLPVVAGDVIVMGSDGLLDNMSDKEMVAQVGALLQAGAKPAAMAQQMAKVAFDNSLDKQRITPYSRAATEAFDMVYSGGKPDDITVLVAVVS